MKRQVVGEVLIGMIAVGLLLNSCGSSRKPVSAEQPAQNADELAFLLHPSVVGSTEADPNRPDFGGIITGQSENQYLVQRNEISFEQAIPFVIKQEKKIQTSEVAIPLFLVWDAHIGDKEILAASYQTEAIDPKLGSALGKANAVAGNEAGKFYINLLSVFGDRPTAIDSQSRYFIHLDLVLADHLRYRIKIQFQAIRTLPVVTTTPLLYNHGYVPGQVKDTIKDGKFLVAVREIKNTSEIPVALWMMLESEVLVHYNWMFHRWNQVKDRPYTPVTDQYYSAASSKIQSIQLDFLNPDLSPKKTTSLESAALAPDWTRFELGAKESVVIYYYLGLAQSGADCPLSPESYLDLPYVSTESGFPIPGIQHLRFYSELDGITLDTRILNAVRMSDVSLPKSLAVSEIEDPHSNIQIQRVAQLVGPAAQEQSSVFGSTPERNRGHSGCRGYVY